MTHKNLTTISLILVLLLFASACTEIIRQPDVITPKTSKDISAEELKKFSTADQLESYLKDQQSLSGQYYGGYPTMMRGGMMESAMDSSMTKSAAPSAGIAGDFSGTNVQVSGVDEADFVKNDGEFIYVLSQQKLKIVKANPASSAELVSEIEFKGYPRNIYVNGDQLIVFMDDSKQTLKIYPFDFVPRPYYRSVTKIVVYDISDRVNPKESKSFEVTGNYLESRMIEDNVYLIAQEGTNWYGPRLAMPEIKIGDSRIMNPDVYYFDIVEPGYNFNTIASFNLNTGDLDAKTFMLGWSSTIYVSHDNMYISFPKQIPYRYHEDYAKDRFFEVILPLLPEEVGQKVSSVLADSSKNPEEQWSEVSLIIENMYNAMSEEEKQAVVTKIDEAVQKYEFELDKERRKTVIHKISIENGEINYGARGEVSGSLLDQFAMDEHNGNLRVATTVYVWTAQDSTMYNNVFVLDSDMKTIGKLEDIAPEERIYSTRFMGDKLYMVTFKNIDPLFIIDLSKPESPAILGSLKIPGYSDYLHPIDENHILGIGKETEANEWGGVSTGGVKIALFDVSDVKSPKPVNSLEIGEAGSDSDALYDHKAFLYDARNNLIVLPIREVTGRVYDDQRGYFRNDVWQGAYVFKVTAEKGVSELAKISHGKASDEYWYDAPTAIKRSLYIGDTLFTVSNSFVQGNEIGSFDKVASVDLKYQEEVYPYPVPYYGGIMVK